MIELTEEMVREIVSPEKKLGSGFSKNVYEFNKDTVLKIDSSSTRYKLESMKNNYNFDTSISNFMKIDKQFLGYNTDLFRLMIGGSENQSFIEFIKIQNAPCKHLLPKIKSDLYCWKGKFCFLQEKAKTENFWEMPDFSFDYGMEETEKLIGRGTREKFKKELQKYPLYRELKRGSSFKNEIYALSILTHLHCGKTIPKSCRMVVQDLETMKKANMDLIRDIKPDNLGIIKRRIKIIDVGI